MHPFSTLSITAVAALLARVSISTTAPLPLAPDAAHALGTQLQRAANLDKEPDTVLLCGTSNDTPTRADCFIFPLEGDAKVEADGYSITRLHLQGGQIQSTTHLRRDIEPATTTITPHCFASLTSSVLSQTATLPLGPAMESAASAALASFASAASITARTTVTPFATTMTTANGRPEVKATPARNGTMSVTGTPMASAQPVTGEANVVRVEALVRMWLAVVGGLLVL